ncbi:hypothetical protein UY3_02400 [Chelonia mydas]|uniref:Uncharacterized protein n=1 Tax=Chelonia mydas TaxID=8469 RepID=M7BT79_CHEMY|nr:hypothetical protein UY3_02400 [Chelonia mydas]
MLLQIFRRPLPLLCPSPAPTPLKIAARPYPALTACRYQSSLAEAPNPTTLLQGRSPKLPPPQHGENCRIGVKCKRLKMAGEFKNWKVTDYEPDFVAFAGANVAGSDLPQPLPFRLRPRPFQGPEPAPAQPRTGKTQDLLSSLAFCHEEPFMNRALYVSQISWLLQGPMWLTPEPDAQVAPRTATAAPVALGSGPQSASWSSAVPSPGQLVVENKEDNICTSVYLLEIILSDYMELNQKGLLKRAGKQETKQWSEIKYLWVKNFKGAKGTTGRPLIGKVLPF